MFSRRLSRFIEFADRQLPASLPKWRQGHDCSYAIAKDLQQFRPSLPQKEQVSIIISTVDRGRFLARTLQSLKHLRYSNFEVVVVEGPSSDDTVHILNIWEDRIRRVACPVMNLSASRNIGIRAAQGTLVAFIDDDAVPEPDWLDRLVEPFADPAVAAAGGPIRDSSGVSFQCRALRVDIEGVAHETTAGILERGGVCPALTGTNFCMRRDLAIAVGLFDENFAYFLEETDIQQRLFDAGFSLAYVRDAEVHHLFAPSALRFDRNTPKEFSTLLSSQTYYILKHCSSRDERGHLCLRIARHLNRMHKKTRHLATSGRISEVAAAALMRSAFRGVHDGIRKATQAQVQNATDIHEPVTSRPLQQFSAPDPARLCLALVCLPAADASTTKAIQLLASAIAAREHEVTLVMSGTRTTVEYRDGYWLHKIAKRFECSWDRPRQLSIQRGLAELRRVEIHRNFHFAVTITRSVQQGAFVFNVYEYPITSKCTRKVEFRAEDLTIKHMAESADVLLRLCVPSAGLVD